MCRKAVTVAVCMCVPVLAQKGAVEKTVQEKNVTVISAETSADGKSTIAKEVVDECIVSLPRADELEPMTTAQPVFVKNANGKEGDNRHVKAYTATCEIHYLVRQKELIIITTNSVTAQVPVIKEVTRTVRSSEKIASDSNEGDVFEDLTPRRYYFSTAKGAAENARARARVWLKNHASVVCTD